MRQLQDALVGVGRLGVDTNPVIYFVQGSEEFSPVVNEVFQQVTSGQITVVTSTLTLMETLVLPRRTGDTELEQTFTRLLMNTRNIETVSITPAAAIRAADLRARHKLKPADALQVATAVVNGCDAFLTADGDFKSVTEIRVLDMRRLEL